MSVYRFLGTQISISTANTVNNKPLVRVYCSSSAVLTITDSSNTVVANATLATGESIIVEKAPTDTIQGSNMVAVPVAYRN